MYILLNTWKTIGVHIVLFCVISQTCGALACKWLMLYLDWLKSYNWETRKQHDSYALWPWRVDEHEEYGYIYFDKCYICATKQN